MATNGTKERLARVEEKVINLKEATEGLTKLAIEIKNTAISQHEQVMDKINCVNNDFTNWKARILGIAAGISFVIGIVISLVLHFIKL